MSKPVLIYDVSFDCSTNPEHILMTAQGDEDECDMEVSLWLSGKCVTKPKTNEKEI